MLLLLKTFICFIEFYSCLYIIYIVFNKKNIFFVNVKNINKCYYDNILLGKKHCILKKINSIFLFLIPQVMIFYFIFKLIFIKCAGIDFVKKIFIILFLYFIYYYMYGYLFYILNRKFNKKIIRVYMLLQCFISLYMIILFDMDIVSLKLYFQNKFPHFLIAMIIGFLLILCFYNIIVLYLFKYDQHKYRSIIACFYIFISYIISTIFVLFIGVALIYKFFPLAYGNTYTVKQLLYYTIITYATVGFGDIVPVSFEAQCMSSIISISNILSISFIAAYIVKKD